MQILITLLGKFISLAEELFLEKFIKRAIIPFLKHPVKRLIPLGVLGILIILAVSNRVNGRDVLKFLSSPSFVILVVILVVAEVFDIVLYGIYPEKQKTRRSGVKKGTQK